MKFITSLLLASLLPCGALAQSAQTANLFTPAPSPVVQASATYTGQQFTGSAPIFYWVIACYQIGCVSPFGPISVTGTPGISGLNANRFVTINWAAQNSATSYIVVRGSTNQFPNPCASCVVPALTATSARDNGAGLTSFPPNGYSLATSATGVIFIDNISQSLPTLKSNINGSVQNLGGGGGGSSFYQTVINNGTPLAQRDNLQFVPGSGVTISASDSASPSTTTLTISSTGGGSSFYQTALANGSALTQRDQFDLSAGTGITISASDSSSPSRSTFTIGSNLTQFYQTVLNNGSAQTQRNQLNLIPGTGISISTSDSSSPSRTNVTINATGAGTGDVVGPASSTTNAIALFASGTGKLLSDSTRLLPTGALVGVGQTNTYTTGTQDFSSVSMHIPSGAAAAPTNAGHIAYNSTSQRVRYGIGGGVTRTAATQGAASTSGNCAQYDADGALTASGAACGGSATAPSIVGTFAAVAASTCTATQTGQVGFMTNVDLLGRCSGSAWQYWYKGFQTSLPSIAGTWVNRGAATLTNTTGVAIMSLPSVAGGNIRGQFFSTPVPPYTATVGVYVVEGSSGVASHCGIAIRDSVGGGVHTWAARFSSASPTQFPFLENIRWNSPTVFGGVNLSNATAWGAVSSKEVWLRLVDDGVNRIWSYSKDGFTYFTGYTEARTSIITANQWGYYCYSESTSDTPIGTFFHAVQN